MVVLLVIVEHLLLATVVARVRREEAERLGYVELELVDDQVDELLRTVNEGRGELLLAVEVIDETDESLCCADVRNKDGAFVLQRREERFGLTRFLSMMSYCACLTGSFSLVFVAMEWR